MSKRFDIFRDKRAEIFEASGISEYSSNAGMTLSEVIPADIQPVSGAVKDEDFSLVGERSVRMFYDGKYNIKAGDFVRSDGVMYRVEYVEKRILGNMALLRESI